MASNSPIPNNPDTESRSPKKRRKIDVENRLNPPQITPDHTRWRSASEQRIYSSKLVEALRHRRGGGGGGAVRDTAERVLAVAAKGRTRWSRAILSSRVRMQMSSVNRKHRRAKAKEIMRGRNKVPQMKRKVPMLQQKVQVLGRLVPGCRKVSFPNLLEETTDYIEALEMQVRAMTFLTQLLSGAGAGAGLTGSPVHAPGPVRDAT